MSKRDPIVVFTAPTLSRAEEARIQLTAASAVLKAEGAEAHAEGMFLTEQAARLEQLAEIVSDEDVIAVRDKFADEGLLDIQSVTETTSLN